MDEQEKICLKKQLDDPRKDSKKDSKSSKRNLPVATEMCCRFAAGKCTCGAACPYKHVTLKESRVATVNAANAQVGKTAPPSARKTAPVRQKCARTHANKSVGPHPAFACTDAATYCAQCGGKGQTSHLCPHKCVLSQAVGKSMLLCVTPGTLSRFFREERVDGLRTRST